MEKCKKKLEAEHDDVSKSKNSCTNATWDKSLGCTLQHGYYSNRIVLRYH